MSKEPCPLLKKVSVLDLARRKKRHERIAVLTAYDFPAARAAEEAGIEVILVGASVGIV